MIADRRCPNCGERVPSTSITCPKCYKKIPVESKQTARSESRTGDSPRGWKVPWTPNPKYGLILDIVLGLFGLLGIGQLYCGRKRGIVFLLGGLLFFGCGVAILSAEITAFLSVPFFILYAIGYLICLFDMAMGTMFIRIRK